MFAVNFSNSNLRRGTDGEDQIVFDIVIIRQTRGSNAEHVHHLDDNIQARAGRRGDQAGQGGHDAKDDQVAAQSQRSCLHLNNLMLTLFKTSKIPSEQSGCSARTL